MNRVPFPEGAVSLFSVTQCSHRFWGLPNLISNGYRSLRDKAKNFSAVPSHSVRKLHDETYDMTLCREARFNMFPVQHMYLSYYYILMFLLHCA